MAFEEHDHCDTNIDYQEAITDMRTKDGLNVLLNNIDFAHNR